MSKPNILRWAILFTLSFAAAGCVSTPVTFRTMTNQEFDAAKGRTITADACGFQLFSVIPISINDRAYQAYQALREQAGFDLMTDIKVQEKWYYAYVGTVYCTVLEATAYPRISAPEEPAMQQ
jgi:hypothetical protein